MAQREVEGSESRDKEAGTNPVGNGIPHAGGALV